MPRKLPVICVIGSHEEEWAELSRDIGIYVAESGCHLLTGAGGGIMTAVSKAFVAYRGREGFCLGLVPVDPSESDPFNPRHHPNPYVEIPVVTVLDASAQRDSMPYSRNMTNILSSTLVIALPGHHGTENEVSLAIRMEKPVILYGPKEPFGHFPNTVQRVETIADLKHYADGFLRKARKS